VAPPQLSVETRYIGFAAQFEAYRFWSSWPRVMRFRLSTMRATTRQSAVLWPMEQALPMRIVRSGVCTGQIAAISIFLRPHLWGVELAVYLLIAFVAFRLIHLGFTLFLLIYGYSIGRRLQRQIDAKFARAS
jgi:hypothetical protein